MHDVSAAEEKADREVEAGVNGLDVRRLEDLAVEAARIGGDVLRAAFRDPDDEDRLEIERKAQNDLVSAADRASEEAILRHLFDAAPDSRALAEEGGLLGAEGERDFAADWSGIEWIVDPLDGTTNFLEGLPIWSVSIAAREVVAGEPGRLLAGVVFEPMADRCFSASFGQGLRRDGRDIAGLPDKPPSDAFLATGFPFRAHRGIDLYLECFREVFLSVRAIRRCGSAALDLAYVACGIYDGFFEFRLSAWDIAAGACLIRESGGVVTDLDGGEDFLRSGNILAGRATVHSHLRRIVGSRASEARLDQLVDRP